MSAERYGARLLEEVQEESLEQVLAELRCVVDPRPRSVLGVPQLDGLLESLRYPATQNSPPRRAWPSSPGIGSAGFDDDDDRSDEDHQDDDEVSPGGPQPRAPAVKPKAATIELTSVKSASGKTSLLSYLCAVSVLPRDAGGKESTVVYVDADGRFSAARLAQMMNHYIQSHHRSSNGPLTDSEAQQTIRSALDHVHVFRPQSSAQLVSILSSLPTYLLDGSRHHSMHRPLSLVVVDSATTFYWQDRSDQAMARLESPRTAAGGGPSRAAETIEKLKALQERFECAVLVSTTSSSSSSSTSPPFPSASTRTLNETTTTTTTTTTSAPPAPPAPSDRDIRLVSPWTSYATLSLSLARLPVAQFPAQMGMDECLRDRDKRLEAVRKGRFVATLVPSGPAAHLGPESERGKGRGVLGFRITREGVEFE